jgi:hypothetical protein
MKTYEVIIVSTMCSTNKLKNKVEAILNEISKNGHEIVTVSFGVNMWWMPTAFITICK